VVKDIKMIAGNGCFGVGMRWERSGRLTVADGFTLEGSSADVDPA
jgi:hypothetical protein